MTKVLIAPGARSTGCRWMRYASVSRDLVEILHQRSDRFRSTSGILLMFIPRNVSGHEQGGIGVPINNEWSVLG
jgi:hypothetical protein